jgi:hypothetical protein
MDNGRYKVILDRLAMSDTNLTPQKLKDLEVQARRMANKSSRHHYIPQHYIKGFADDDGLLSVYDKQRDIIKSKRVGPNGVFYEVDRNTVVMDDGISISTIEDGLYSQFDTKFANCIRFFRDTPVQIAIEDVDNRDILSAFMVDLFWRNPIADYAFDNLMANSDVYFHDAKTGERYKDLQHERELKNDPVMRKIERAKMMSVALRSIVEDKQLQPHIRKLRHLANRVFILGDYPILYQSTPRSHSDNLGINFFLPISSHRIYSENKLDIPNFNIYDAYTVNALIIDQSKTIACGPNHEILENSVSCYRYFKKMELFDYCKRRLFDGVDNDRAAPGST